MTDVVEVESSDSSDITELSDPQWLVATRDRRERSRRRLLVAAMNEFRARGYFATSVDDIAARAGLSRMTLYRHFKNKADLAIEIFEVSAGRAMPRLRSIADRDYQDPAVIKEWLTQIFEADRANRQLLNVLIQARADQTGFTDRAQQFLATLISELGRSIPAFALNPQDPGQRRRWLQAWLLLYEILDQSNHAALESGVAGDPLVLDVLAERFVQFTGDSSS